MNLCNVWISQDKRVYRKHPFEGWLSVESTADTSRVNYVIIIQHSVLCHSHWYDRLLRINRSANEFPGAFCRSLLGQLSAFVDELSNKSRHGGDGRLLPTYDNSLTYSLIFRTWHELEVASQGRVLVFGTVAAARYFLFADPSPMIIFFTISYFDLHASNLLLDFPSLKDSRISWRCLCNFTVFWIWLK